MNRRKVRLLMISFAGLMVLGLLIGAVIVRARLLSQWDEVRDGEEPWDFAQHGSLVVGFAKDKLRSTDPLDRKAAARVLPLLAEALDDRTVLDGFEQLVRDKEDVREAAEIALLWRGDTSDTSSFDPLLLEFPIDDLRALYRSADVAFMRTKAAACIGESSMSSLEDAQSFLASDNIRIRPFGAEVLLNHPTVESAKIFSTVMASGNHDTRLKALTYRGDRSTLLKASDSQIHSIVHTALRAVIFDNEPAISSAALDVIGSYPSDKGDIPSVLRLFASGRRDVLIPVIRTLDSLRAKEATERLRGYLDDRDDLVRASTTLALARMQDQASVPQIEKALSDPSTPVRNAAAHALNMVGRPESFAVLADALQHANRSQEHRDSIERLGIALQTWGDTSGRARIEAIAKGGDPRLKRICANVLREIGSRSTPKGPDKSKSTVGR